MGNIISDILKLIRGFRSFSIRSVYPGGMDHFPAIPTYDFVFFIQSDHFMTFSADFVMMMLGWSFNDKKEHTLM